MRATFHPDYEDGYDLNDPVQYGQWLALEAERRRTGYYSNGYVNQYTRTNSTSIPTQSEITRHLDKMRQARTRSSDLDRGLGIDVEQSKGLAIASFIQSEVMGCDFIDDVPVSQLVLQIKLRDELSFRNIWGLHEPGSTIWVPFSEYFRLVNHAINIVMSKHTYSGYLVFCDIDELVSITTWERLSNGLGKREDVGNINLPTYGVGARDSFVETLATLVLVPSVMQLLVKAGGIGSVNDLSFTISDEDLARLRDAWSDAKDLNSIGALDQPVRFLLNNRALFENLVNSAVNSLNIRIPM